jgi:hypothetical protein
MTPELCLDIVLQQAMNEDHVATDQFLLPGHDLLGDRSAMGNEFEIKRRDEPAGIAFADRSLLDVTQPAAERKVCALDRVLQKRAVELRRGEIDEGRVPLELRELEWRAERPHDRVDQVGKDVLGMVEFDAGQIGGVAGDVSYDEARRFGFGQHGITFRLAGRRTRRYERPLQSTQTAPARLNAPDVSAAEIRGRSRKVSPSCGDAAVSFGRGCLF